MTAPDTRAPTPGRVLALDYGRARIGAAVSDPAREFAFPLEIIRRSGSTTAEARRLRALVDEHEVALVVVGLPVHTTGRESELSRETRAWAAWLERAVERPVVLHDERYTSVEAERLMIESGLKRAKRADRRDALAACLLLRAFLDSHASRGADQPAEPPAPLDDDDDEPAEERPQP